MLAMGRIKSDLHLSVLRPGLSLSGFYPFSSSPQLWTCTSIRAAHRHNTLRESNPRLRRCPPDFPTKLNVSDSLLPASAKGITSNSLRRFSPLPNFNS